MPNRQLCSQIQYDSFNLETEYRELLLGKHLMHQTPDATSRTVQVLDGLYEVDLNTKKCYSIYWKSRIMSFVYLCSLGLIRSVWLFIRVVLGW